MKTLLAALAGFVCCVYAPAAGPEDSAVKVNRTKFLGDRRENSSTTGGWGSGTVVGSAAGKCLVLTNKHVAPDKEAFYFVLHDKRAYAARWVGVDDKVDLALLEIDADLPAVPVTDADPKPGDDLKMWGCLHAGPMLARTGRADSDADNHRDEKGYAYLRATFRGGHGDSGAGVFNKAGALVGVVYAGPDEGEGWNMNVKIGDVRRFLGDRAKGDESKPGTKLRDQPK